MRNRSFPARRGVHALAVSLVAVAALPGMALAQSPSAGPSSAERAVTLASPAVVFIDTKVAVKVILTYQKSGNISGLGHVNQTYNLDYGTGSGFVVNPNGVVVTASHVVEPDDQALQNYAANKLILEGLNYSYPKANSSPFSQYTLPLHSLSVVLQQCYKAIACDFTITPTVTVYSALDVSQATLPQGKPARVLSSTGFAATDVAILQIEGSNMPTVSLAKTATDLASGDDVIALGFPGSSTSALTTGVTTPAKVFGHVSNIRTEGTSKLVEIDANIEPGESGGPVVNSSGDVIGLVSFTLLQSSGAAGQKYLRTVDDVRTALSATGVEAQRGPTDTAFQQGMEDFWAHHYTAAVPLLQKATQLYEGFPLALEFLSEAQAKKGTAADVPLEKTSSFPIWIVFVVVGVLIVVIALVVLLSRRGRKGEPPGAVPLAAVVPQVAPVITPPVVAPAPEETSAAREPQPVMPPPPPMPEPEGTPVPTVPPTAPEHEIAHFCPNCGHAVDADTHFCPNCGHEINPP
ncbi:MAG: trypsin-like peptidase domain-containing protein [Actinomycetota bacterium]|nr:trypsin-like peptidase domain-containing protein [Actinomycetota bacterium]